MKRRRPRPGDQLAGLVLFGTAVMCCLPVIPLLAIGVPISAGLAAARDRRARR